MCREIGWSWMNAEEDGWEIAGHVVENVWKAVVGKFSQILMDV
jgi:hypothetical protein